jgi:phosphoglycolate phosphatase
MHLIIFDFDGTIADSSAIFAEATNRLARDFAYPPILSTQLSQIRNMSSRETIE